MNKYKEKTSFGEEKLMKEDEEYLLKESRPVKETTIKKLNKKKMNQFIEDILTNKKLTSVLYATNAKIEIKSYLRTKKNLQNSEKKVRDKYEPSYLVRKQNIKDAYFQMRNAIDNYKIEKENHKNLLKQNNLQKFLEYKKLNTLEKNEGNQTARINRIKSFNRAFSKIEKKLNNIKNETNTKINYTNNTNRFVTENNINPEMLLPETKLNINNVYSRLYNNSVLITPVYKNNFYRFISKEKTQTLGEKSKKQKIIFNIKNVLNNTNGKEFTIDANGNTINKCFTKYSGGPENIQFLKYDDKQKLNKNDKDKVDFYELIDKNTGDSYLHKAVIDGCPEIVEYFLNKGAEINKQNNNGDTALHIAAKNENMQIIEILLKHKAALDIPNKEGVIPFELFTHEIKKEFGIGKMTVVNPTKNNS